MPAATRIGDMSAGHCFYPVPLQGGSGNVFINGRGAGRVGDPYPPHSCGNSTHQGNLGSGSSKVFINGRAAGRVGDSLTCGDTVGMGSPNVFIGG